MAAAQTTADHDVLGIFPLVKDVRKRRATVAANSSTTRCAPGPAATACVASGMLVELRLVGKTRGGVSRTEGRRCAPRSLAPAVEGAPKGAFARAGGRKPSSCSSSSL